MAGDASITEGGEQAFVRRILITLALLLLGLVLWQLTHLLLLVLGSVLLAILLLAMARPLQRWLGLSEGLALALSVAMVIGLIGGGVWLFGAEIGAQASALFEALPGAWAALESRMSGTGLGRRLMTRLGNELPSLVQVVGDVSRLVLSATMAVADAVVIIIGGIYFAIHPKLYREGLLKLFPKHRHDLGREALDMLTLSLQRWLVGKLIAMVIIGVLTGVGLSVIGVPSAMALGLFAGLAEFVPLVGPIIAAIPALLLALGQGGDTALWALVLLLLVQQLESNIVTPLIQQRTVSLPPALTLFAVIAAGLLFGVLGILFSGPLTVIGFVAVKLFYVRETLRLPTSLPERNGENSS